MTTMVRKRKKAKDFVLVEPFLLQKLGLFRHPFMMVDRIVDLKGGDKPVITSIKCVATNEPHFMGHFPDFPVMPGVLIGEAFGQTSEYLNVLLQFLECYREEHGVSLEEDLAALRRELHSAAGMRRIRSVRENTMGFLASQDLKFKGVVLPGDTLEITSEMFMSDSSGFNHFNVEARVRNKVVCSGRISNWRRVNESFYPDEESELT